MFERISIDPNICHAKACIKGTRVMVSVLVDSVAAGMAVPKIKKSFPSITEADIRAALAYAAALTREQVFPYPILKKAV